jgi:hypothetical protein
MIGQSRGAQAAGSEVERLLPTSASWVETACRSRAAMQRTDNNRSFICIAVYHGLKEEQAVREAAMSARQRRRDRRPAVRELCRCSELVFFAPPRSHGCLRITQLRHLVALATGLAVMRATHGSQLSELVVLTNRVIGRTRQRAVVEGAEAVV